MVIILNMVLRVEGLTVSRGVRELLRDVELQVGRGQRVALMGASGSGKSLTASAVLGLLDPRFSVRGRLAVSSRELPWRQGLGERPGMAAVFQDSRAALNPLVRLDRQLVPAVARRRGVRRAEARELVHRLLGEVGFDEPDRVLASRSSQLSGGQRQRVCLSLAMASRPRLLVADEPTTALDMISQQQVVTALRRCTGEDRSALLFITHDLAVAADLCDRAVVLHRGSVVDHGPMQQIIETPRAEFSAALVASAHGSAAVATPGQDLAS
jgi:peptide/nickel transport system ATP-binding protein